MHFNIQFHIKLTTESQYWVSNVRALNGRNMLTQPQRFDTMVYSDASKLGYGGYAISAKRHWSVRDTGWKVNKERVPPGRNLRQCITCY